MEEAPGAVTKSGFVQCSFQIAKASVLIGNELTN